MTATIWARRYSGDEVVLRFEGTEESAVAKAEWIAHQSGQDGAVSVWVADAEGQPIWAAGEKARELGWGSARG